MKRQTRFTLGLESEKGEGEKGEKVGETLSTQLLLEKLAANDVTLYVMLYGAEADWWMDGGQKEGKP